MQASIPKDYRATLRVINKPLSVLVGSEDQVFIASEYIAALNSYSKGEVFIIDGETHNGIRHSSDAMKKLKAWAIKNKLRYN